MTASMSTYGRTDYTAARAMSRHIECRLCGRRGKGCVPLDGTADGAWLCYRTESPRPTNGGGWLHPAVDGGRDWRDALSAMPVPRPMPTRPEVDVDACDRAYRAILAACPLSTAHREAMLARGMTATEIEVDGYGTLPRGGREDLGALAAAAAGEAAAGRVPGLVPNDRGRIIVVGSAGMLVPVRDVVGRVVGLRIRVDGETDGGKYRWLSTGDQTVAGIDGNTCHVVIPEGSTPRRVIVTEGEIKAAITARKLCVPVVSVPGVGNVGRVIEVVANLAGDHAVEVVSVAYDADDDDNPHVAANRDRLCEMLVAAGYRVDLLRWNAADGKGIDDLLARGLMPMPVAYRPATEIEVGPVVDQLRQERDAAVQHADRLVEMAKNKPNLGGDSGSVVAQLLYAAVCKQKQKQKQKPPADGKYRIIPSKILEGSRRENGNIVGGVVSPGTFRKTVDRWIDAGLVPITVETEYVSRPGQHPNQVPRHVYVVDLGEANDIAALADPLCSGDMYAATGTARPRRGGDRTCQDCGGTSFVKTVELVCAGCGSTHSRKVSLVEDPCTQTLRALERIREVENYQAEEADPVDDDQHANFACRPAEPEALRMQRSRSTLAALRREGHNPRLGMADQLVVDETVRPMTERLAGEVADYRGEIELWLLADRETQDRDTA